MARFFHRTLPLSRFAPGVLVFLLSAALAGCGGGGGSDASAATPPPSAAAACGIERQKQFVLSATRDWYLFLELLPATVDAARYATADALLDALTANARAQSKDRFFSYLTSASAEQQFFSSAESVGFGVSTSIRDGNRLFVTQVFAASAAADAGFARGDEILAIGAAPGALQEVAVLLAQPNGLNDALGPSEAGVSRTFRVRTLAGTVLERTVAKRAFSLDPVPDWSLIERAGLTPVGYVNLRTFVQPADQALRDAFAAFRDASVRDVVVDLRYNGGGLVTTAELLGSLLAADDVGEVLYETRLNARHVAEQESVLVRAEAAAIPALNVAFLVSQASASASELVINALAPYANVAVVGERTYGKPVGQFAFDLDGCDERLRLVTFKSVNREGYGDYYTGLPPDPPDSRFRHTFCFAGDDLTHAQGDAAESMTGEALHWIDNGACRATAALRAESALPLISSGLPPRPRRPTPEQVYQPGFL